MSKGFYAILSFCIFGFCLYFNILNGEFISDDFITIVHNPAVKDPANLPAIWNAFNTRFLVGLSFSVNDALGGLNTSGYHIVNICLHIINTFLVYQLILLIFQAPYFKKRKLSIDPNRIAFYAAIIFLCHPLQTQAVAFITQRAVLMATGCYLLTVIFYLKARISGKSFYKIIAIFTMLLGMFCKELVITIPIMLFVCEMLFGEFKRENLRRIIKNIAPFSLVFVFLPLILHHDNTGTGSVLGLKNQMMKGGMDWHYFLTEISYLKTYIRLFCVPVLQRHIYVCPIIKSPLEISVLFSLGLTVFLIVTAIGMFKNNRIISFCISWFFVSIPVELIAVSVVKKPIIYEHWMYLSTAGLSLLTAYLICRIPSKGIMKTVFTIILMALCLLTINRNEVWKTEIGFWEDNAVKTPHNRTVQFALARAYDRKNNYARAIDHYHKTIEISPENPLAYNNLGVVYLKLKRDGLALENFQKAIALDPGAPAAYNNIGYLYFLKNDWAGALRYYEQSLTHRETPEALFYLGKTYLAVNEKQKARDSFVKARIYYRQLRDESKPQEISEILKKEF